MRGIKSGTKALLDNSSFAGAMRFYDPNIGLNQLFYSRYPYHEKNVDRISMGEFLMAICLFDGVVLDTSSEERPIHIGHTMGEEKPGPNFLLGLLNYLPSEVQELISLDNFYDTCPIGQETAQRVAFDIFCSPYAKLAKLPDSIKIPSIYSSKDYVFRKYFDKLNFKNNEILDENLLVQAMFLHRGLILQGCASYTSMVYLPYLYRGKMLSNLSPLLAIAAPYSLWTPDRVQLPYINESLPKEIDVVRQISDFYYRLIRECTWEKHDERLPFLGAAILSKARGNPKDAISIALEFRHKNDFRSDWDELQNAIARRDRPKYKTIMKKLKKEITVAATSLGADISDDNLFLLSDIFNIAVSYVPDPFKKGIELSIKLLPDSAREWGKRIVNKYFLKSDFQMLFLDHVEAIRQQAIV